MMLLSLQTTNYNTTMTEATSSQGRNLYRGILKLDLVFVMVVRLTQILSSIETSTSKKCKFTYFVNPKHIKVLSSQTHLHSIYTDSF